MFVLVLAARYLLARPISYLAMVAIGVAVAALIVVISVMNGFLEETRHVVRGTTADIIVLPIQNPGRGSIAPREELERLVSGHAQVAGACSRIVRPAVVKVHGSDNLSLGDAMFASDNQLLVLGIDPAAELAVTDLSGYLAKVTDAALAVDDPADPFTLARTKIADPALRTADLPRVLVGSTRMERLGLEKGMALEMVTVPEGEGLDSDKIRATTETFIIAGAFETGHLTFDMGSVFVKRDDFSDWIGSRQELSEMYVRVRDGADLPTVRDELKDLLRSHRAPAEVETWMDRNAVYLGAVENERNILGFVLLLFVLLTCTITFSMLTMMVQEKIRDIGILSAMGSPAGGIASVFVTCGLFVSAAGGLFGLGAGILVATHVNVVKDWIESTFDIHIFNPDVYAFTEIPSSVDVGLSVQIVVATMLFSVVICLWPALRAARMDPVDALRHE